MSTWKHHDVSRLEGFSDAVFAFALTLLVVSLEVPSTFGELMGTMRGFAPFAASFAIIAWLWYEHNVFFRRFGLRDRLTVVINAVLLFVVLFYVYPLKFVFTLVFQQTFGIRGGRPVSTRMEDSATLMTIYGVGFVVIFLCLALFYWRAWRRRDDLQLDALATFDARAGMMAHLLSAAVGVLSIVVALGLPPRLAWLAGPLYGLLGPVHATHGFTSGRRRERLERALGAPPAAGA